MRRRASWLLLLAFLSLFSYALAKSPTSFCKCTCDGNSTIVALEAPAASQKASLDLRERASKKTCNDCNRQFCLGYSFCQGVEEDKVFTTCFQRDSAKDQAVVWIFILATAGLLSYAGMRPWVDQWAESARQRRNYIPVSAQPEQ